MRVHILYFLTESITDKSKVTFQDERTKYHEVPEDGDRLERQESFDDHVSDYPDEQEEPYNEQDERFQDEEKFEDQEAFNEADDQYQDEVFNEEQERQEEEPLDFQPEQPKLTPKQRWHRAYNKIVMQLNVSTFSFFDIKIRLYFKNLIKMIFI